MAICCKMILRSSIYVSMKTYTVEVAMSDTIIDCHIYSSHILIRANREGFIGYNNGHIQYAIKMFCIPKFNYKGYFIGNDEFFYFDKDQNLYRLPRYAQKFITICFDKMKEFGLAVDVNYIYHDPISPRYISNKMQDHWVDRPEHIPALEHFANTEKSMLACEMQTGKGKTYLAIKASILRKKPFMVCCTGLIQQWVENILDKTDIKKEEIYVLQESDSVVNLCNMINDSKTLPKVIVASIPTLRSYILAESEPYKSLMLYEDMMDSLGIGTLIHDEFHLDFKANVIIDVFSNVEMNYYLSATPRRSDRLEKRMFNLIYPSEIFGGKNNYDKYVDITLYSYKLATGKPVKYFTSYYGYLHSKYEEILIRDKGLLNQFSVILERILYPSFFSVYEPGQARCVIYASSKQMCRVIRDLLCIKYDNFTIKTYLTGEKSSNLEADVIIGTSKGIGVGKDVPKLAVVLNTISFSADSRLEQMVGRLRKIPGIECKYFDMYNETIPDQVRHTYSKTKIYKRLARNFNKVALSS